MFARRGARSVGLWTCVSATALAVFATTAHGQSQIQEEQLPDLCSGAYYNRAAYIVRFDVQTNTFSRPATDPLESEEIVLCMDGTPDPLVTYSIEYADQTAGEAPSAQSVSVGSAPTAYRDPRVTNGSAGQTLKCRTCQTLLDAQSLLQEELDRATRTLSSMDTPTRWPRPYQPLIGPCASSPFAPFPEARGEFCRSRPDATVVQWLNAELSNLNAQILLIDGSWIARTGSEAPEPSTELTLAANRPMRFGPGQTTSPAVVNLTAPANDYTLSFQVDPGFDSELSLFEQALGSNTWRQIDFNDDRSPYDRSSQIQFTARRDHRYRARVTSYYSHQQLQGTLSLSRPSSTRAARVDDTSRAEQAAASAATEAESERALEHLKQVIRTQLATYDRLRAIAENLTDAQSQHRRAYRVGSYAGNRLLLLRVREHQSTFRLSEDGSSLVHSVNTISHSSSITIKETSWFSLNAGIVVSGLPRHTFRARPASETQSALVRDITDWSVDPVFFATIHWCAQDLSRPIFARRCAGYAPTPRDVVDPADVPLGTGRFNHLSPESSRLQRVERARRWAPGFAIGVPLNREAFDFNLMFGISLPYIPYVSVITGLQLARVTRAREGIGLAPASGAVGDATTFGAGENAIDAGTHQRLVPGWFIAITITDEIFRALFPSLEAASK